MTLATAWEAVVAFLERGGPVLSVIFVVTALMWTAIVERTLYFLFWHRRHSRRVLAAWDARSERESWYAEQVREQLLSQSRHRLDHSQPILRALVAVCPLLGLLGTVTGMIEVFDVMAVAGNGNPRAMAAGVSRATIPTMAGMVAALSGFLFSSRLQRQTTKQADKLEALLCAEGS